MENGDIWMAIYIPRGFSTYLAQNITTGFNAFSSTLDPPNDTLIELYADLTGMYTGTACLLDSSSNPPPFPPSSCSLPPFFSFFLPSHLPSFALLPSLCPFCVPSLLLSAVPQISSVLQYQVNLAEEVSWLVVVCKSEGGREGGVALAYNCCQVSNIA